MNSAAVQIPSVTHSPYRCRMRPRKKGVPFQRTAAMSQSMRLLSRRSRFQSRRDRRQVKAVGDSHSRSQKARSWAPQRFS